MKKSILITIIAGLLLALVSSAWADATVNGEGVGVPQKQRLAGGPKGWTATHQYRILKGGIAPGDIRPAFITGWGYEPSQIQDAYGFSSLQADGTGQKVAIIVAYGSPTLNEDVTAFCKEFGLPPPILNVIYPGGEPTAYDAGWAFETSLDVEWVHALAPGATIDLVIAPSNLFSDLFYAILYATETLQAQVVSMSWGGSEFAGEAQYDWVFQNTGTVFIASTGDSGSGAQYPAVSRRVVAAGGTSLYLNPGTGTLKFPEAAWEESGGGPSKFAAMPGYQSTFGISASTNRCIPDVAFNGDPYSGVWVYDSNYDPSTGPLWIAGGTSLAAQCWAAIIALADQGRAAAGLQPLTDGHHALYTLAGSSARYNVKGYYRDITWGYNGNFAAKKGYDLVTGLGSPMAEGLIPALGAVDY